ncbi:MAG: WbqC family protein [Cyclobacteriaceae bacterium]|nr:WbqC family protein [Cyclobacteriaceae bacterium]
MAAWKFYDRIFIESKESFIKQTFRNRTRILTANKIENLIVPVEKGNRNIPIQEIRIDRKQEWVKKHLKSIQSAYGNAPFYEHYSGDLSNILNKNHRFLFDLNLELFEFILHALSLKKDLHFTRQFIRNYGGEFTDLRSYIHPKKTISAEVFYEPVAYIQVFGKTFVDNLSVIDLIFNEGPDARHKICTAGRN